MQNVAYFAHLDNAIEGTALRTADGVFFLAEATGLWTELTNADASRLQLLGRVDIADAQRLADGDLVKRASRTVQEVV